VLTKRIAAKHRQAAGADERAAVLTTPHLRDSTLAQTACREVAPAGVEKTTGACAPRGPREGPLGTASAGSWSSRRSQLQFTREELAEVNPLKIT
jgi:hypothetical protein